jgi:hypothetical protein
MENHHFNGKNYQRVMFKRFSGLALNRRVAIAGSHTAALRLKSQWDAKPRTRRDLTIQHGDVTRKLMGCATISTIPLNQPVYIYIILYIYLFIYLFIVYIL